MKGSKADNQEGAYDLLNNDLNIKVLNMLDGTPILNNQTS